MEHSIAVADHAPAHAVRRMAMLPVGAAPEADAQQALTFSLHGEVYGVDILGVREILAYTRPTTIPMVPAFVCGVINLRGNVVPVIDLALRFGRPATELRTRTCIVIMEVDGADGPQAIGVLVDAVNAVFDMDAAQIEPPLSFGIGQRKDYIRGLVRTDDGFIILLDVGRVLPAEDLAGLDQVMA